MRWVKRIVVRIVDEIQYRRKMKKLNKNAPFIYF